MSFEEGFHLIETLRYNGKSGFIRLQLHIARLGKTAQELGIKWDQKSLVERLQALANQSKKEDRRVRIALYPDGEMQIQSWALASQPRHFYVSISTQRLNSSDPWLRLKTSKRYLYDQARADLPSNIDEILFLNEKNELCEGSITNIFVEKNGMLLTPPLECGLLPGVLRAELLEAGKARLSVLTAQDLYENDFYLGNSLRGLIKGHIPIKNG